MGIGLTAWHYMWRITPLHRRELPGSWADDAPPPLPPDTSLEDSQLSEAGVGPLYHRRYEARIAEAKLSAEQLMERIVADPNKLAPVEFARFTKVHGEKGRMEPGDEYVVRMPGPWDGPVRVVEVTPTSFRFLTLDRHLEAGQIEFRVRAEGDELVFTIESWARSGDRLYDFIYDRVPLAREMQLHMWVHVCEQVAVMAGGRPHGKVQVTTHRWKR